MHVKKFYISKGGGGVNLFETHTQSENPRGKRLPKWRPYGELVDRNIPGLPKLPSIDMAVLVWTDLQHDFILGRAFFAQLVPKGKH